MIPEYLYSPSVYGSSELEKVFRQEGRDYFTDSVIVREAQKVEREDRRVERFVARVFRIAEKAETVADSLTATSLATLTFIRKSGIRVGLMPWEVWSEEQGFNLKEVPQRELVRTWLSDSLFSKDILRAFERVSPEFSDFWGDRFDGIADRMIDSPAKTALGSVLVSFMEGTATISGEASGGVAVGRILVGQVTKALESLSNNVTNEMRGVSEYLAADIRQILSPYDKNLVAETLVSQIVTAGISEFSYRAATVSALSSWLGSSAGITLVGLLHDGPASLPRSVAYSGGMLGSIVYLGKSFRVSLLQKYSEAFARVTKEISSAVQRRTRLADVDYAPGLDSADEELQQQRHAVTKEKNYVSNAVSDGLPTTLSSTAYLFHSGSDYAGLALMVGRSVKEILSINDSYVAFKASLTARGSAFVQLENSLAHVQGTRAPLTDASLGDYLVENIPWSALPFSLGIRSIGVPLITRREKEPINIVRCIDSTQEFILSAGSISLLIGENGDGKSTLIKTLTGNYAGDLENTCMTWSGFDIRSMSAQERKRRIFSLTNMIRGDFRQLVGTILLKYDHVLTSKKYDPIRIRNWVTSDDEDQELEDDVLAYFSQNELLVGMNRNWFKKGYAPSGYEGAVLNYATHLSIREPVLMIIDEFDNGMTVSNLKSFIKYVDRLMENFEGALLVCSNKQIAGWLELERTCGYIDMRRGLIIDRKVHTQHVVDLVSSEKLAELNDKFEHNQPMSIAEFYTWMTLPGGPRDLQIQKMMNLHERLGYGSLEINFTECGIQEWENGIYGKYLVHNLERWVYEVTTPEEMLIFMRNLNLFYCTHYELEPGKRARRDLKENLLVGRSWSASLVRQFNAVLNQFIDLNNESVRRVTDNRYDDPAAFVFADQFSMALSKTSNFLDFYAHNYSLHEAKRLSVNLFSELHINSDKEGTEFLALFDDPVFIYSICNFGKSNISFRNGLLRYIRSCSDPLMLNEFTQKLKTSTATNYYSGEQIVIWDLFITEQWFVEALEERTRISAMMAD